MGDRVDTGGLATALQLLGAAGHVDGGEAGQADLFEAEAPLPLPLAAKPASGGKPGRPPGARNRSTEEWVRFHLSRYRSPLTALGELYSRDTGELVDQLQAMADKHKSWRETKDGGHWERVAINPLDVLRLQMQAQAALLPYIHKKQPMALEIDQRTRGIVVVGDLTTVAAGSSDDLALPLAPIEENQGVSGAASEKSDAGKVGRDGMS